MDNMRVEAREMVRLMRLEFKQFQIGERDGSQEKSLERGATDPTIGASNQFIPEPVSPAPGGASPNRPATPANAEGQIL